MRHSRQYTGYRSLDPSPTRRSRIEATDVKFGQDVRTVVLKRPSQQHGLGFSVRGGRELGLGIYISKVESLSHAEKAGIKAGDQIISVNGKSFESVNLQEAIKILKSFSTLHMTLRAVGRVPSTCILHQTYTWVDRHGRRVSPPDEYEPQFHRSSSTWSLYSAGKNSKVRKILLSLKEGESLGLMIRGGTEYGLGIYITGVDPDSAADRANLQIGDQILEVNDVSFEDITHDEAVRILKHSKHIIIKLLDVGKIPFSCTMYDEMQWGIPGVDDDVQSGLSADEESLSTYFSLADPDTLRMFDEKAKLLLSEEEESTLNYYRTEYDKGQVTLDAFVAVLLELLNTPDKFSLLSDIRELLSTCDREKFDDLIYSREVEIKKTCQKLGSSLEHLVASQKSDKSKTAGHSYKYTSLDKCTGKITRHHNSGTGKDMCRHSFSGPDARRRISSKYESSPHALSASTQALYWGTEDLVGDEMHTPSEDSGVDLANGYYYGSRDFQWKSHRLPSHSNLGIIKDQLSARQKQGLWARRRHSSGGEGSLDGVTSPSRLNPVMHPNLEMTDGSRYSAGRRWSTHSDQGIQFHSNLAHIRQFPPSPVDQHILHPQHQHHAQKPPSPPKKTQRSLPCTHLKPTVVTFQNLLQDCKSLKPTDLPEKQIRIVVPKNKPTLGIAIEGGADTRHPLPRIINIHPKGAASLVSGLKVGHVVLAVDGQSLTGLNHHIVANHITKAYADPSHSEMELIVGKMKKPTLEMRRSSIMPVKDVRRCLIRENDVRTAAALVSPHRLIQQLQYHNQHQRQQQQPSQQLQQQPQRQHQSKRDLAYVNNP